MAFISVATAGGMLRPAELHRDKGRCERVGDVVRSQVMRWHAPASLQSVQEAAQITQHCMHHQPHISRTTHHPPVGVDVHKGQDAAGAQQALALLDLQWKSTQQHRGSGLRGQREPQEIEGGGRCSERLPRWSCGCW